MSCVRVPEFSTRQRPLRILVANRGEIAVRIQASIGLLGHTALGIHTASEGTNAPHVLNLPPGQRLQIPGQGASAYLNVDSLIRVAKDAKADAVIPGYGFLSESPVFAKAVQDAGMTWIGPRAETLTLFGDKHTSKEFARRAGVPVLPSTSADASLDEIRDFASKLPKGQALMLKALEGGGGRGIRIVRDLSELQSAYDGCRREARAAFPSDRVFAEPFLPQARHIEVQVVGDGTGLVRAVGERECSLQRRNQKLIELCPSPTLRGRGDLRASIISSALALAAEGKLRSLATMEFLLQGDEYYFLECNPRLQVEHTVTEEAYGVDLVATQIRLAQGVPLHEALGATPDLAPRAALQLRINAEKFQPDGSATGTTGTIRSLALPTGPGVRVDTAAHAPIPGVGSYKQGMEFDSLLAKIILTGRSYEDTITRARAALDRLRITGVATNRALLLALCEDPHVAKNEGVHTRYVEENAGQLYEVATKIDAERTAQEAADGPQEEEVNRSSNLPPAGPGEAYVQTHLPGRVVSVAVKEGQEIRKGEEVLIVESMKMEHTVRAAASGKVLKVLAKPGDNFEEGDAVALLSTSEGADDSQAVEEEKVDLDSKPASLQELDEVRAQLQDDHPIRAKATQRRRDRKYRTARENLADLVDAGTFVEYGDLALAAQRTRLSGNNLLATRNDGVIVGWAKVDGQRTAVVMYDYGVLAGTQGYFHHKKLDRIFHSVLENPAPLVLYAEGGGGRPGDVDTFHTKVAGLNGPSFVLLARINFRGIPTIGVANGNLFAGNAALLGTCDFIIATENPGTSVGMGGPAMIEGGGLGVVKPEDVGPIRSAHLKNGNVDVTVWDEAAATEATKTLVGFFHPHSAGAWEKDARLFRHAIPTDRKRAYSMHRILDLITDDDTPFFELGAHWGNSLITGFLRVKGLTLGVVASNVLSPLGGAIDADSARKASRFLRILTKTRACHVLAICDTPGFMVGPKAEPEGGLRAFAEYFAAGAGFVDTGGRMFGLTVRKAYGLGAQALLGGSTSIPFSSVAWPTGEFAGMGVEGAIKLGMKKELDAIPDLEQRAKAEQQFIDDMYARGRAINMAQATEIDSVIDPAETRDWLERCLESVEPRTGYKGVSRL
ncbi:hypothetical protein A1Q1_05230 [Trichosporon asahii var. asahii CBS 2479]|uniref:Acetyl-CoA carboxylase n=1 Tax=Trichosporon asahii var. asahii (strain ATCC 90039 / CBS 2479 / JCM 2466 / KCTC 7840 / NBRC 103889/ NCYC 2677 / UAMH 7654) TaxID=1186058 RepID=J8TYV8_TRIAS|nr:hypothetical protein A1Q1_05230 [Trichosporon asahii var. asahii CBS 2479]EJT53267.1 hypothetical protein A1Q1_05230 [Trichosporon asahii var. asahii CBS 2479]